MRSRVSDPCLQHGTLCERLASTTSLKIHHDLQDQMNLRGIRCTRRTITCPKRKSNKCLRNAKTSIPTEPVRAVLGRKKYSRTIASIWMEIKGRQSSL